MEMSATGRGLFSTYSICSNAAGIAGNLFAFVLFVSPTPTFRRIIRSKSTEQFSGLPYIYALLNCLICLWYGTPIVSPGIILVFTVNSVGAVFQLVYILIFIIYAERSKKLKMLGLLLGVFAAFAAVVSISICLFQPPNRQTFNLVIRTRSVEYMPFYLSLATFLMSLSFFAYGMFKQDTFIYVPNGIGGVLGIIQLVLYWRYSRPNEEPTTPLLESNA
ncbi:bidirectional sugar transporter SWEET2a-like isoform X2 [Lycium ferocissimum]|uniref:bidirectional sugar transporter SWEET2a-like isoform X2 n=1 Tax=Lycium ferocissimum TaxID=112874 RepID=UPI0028156745|nr:bidirectional sugar transporter SWEET2a-like isoform X2 [Lycium ferocissimum]